MANNYGGNFPSFDEYLNQHSVRRDRQRYPFYTDNADYNTNAPSYYDDLARKNKLIEILAKRIWEYDEELAKRFEEWDKNLEEFPEDVKKLLEKWLEDGTLADIINKKIFKDLNDLIDFMRIDVDNNSEDIKDLKKLDYNTRKLLYQKKAMYMDLGSYDNPLFDGAQKANQGIGYIEHNGKEYIFTLSRVEGSAWSEQERQRISMFEYNENGLSVDPIHVSNVLRLGHQGIEPFIENNEIYLICGLYNQKGYTKIKWNGSNTTQEDVKEYELIRENNTENDNISVFYNATPSISKDGKYVVMLASSTLAGGLRYALVYDREEVENKPNKLNVKPLNVFKVDPPSFINAHIVQDVTVDDNFIYILTGYNGDIDPIFIITYGIGGNLISYNKVDTVYNEYSFNELNQDGLVIEPEGLTMKDNNLLVQIVNNEQVENRVVAKKIIYKVSDVKEDNQYVSINSGVYPHEVPSNLHLYGNPNDISLNKGDAFQMVYYDFKTTEFSDILNYTRGHLLSLYDNREGSNNEQHVVIGPYYKDDEQYVIIRSDSSNANGAGFNLATNKGNGDGTITMIASGKEVDYRAYLSGSEGHFRPGTDGKQDIGSSGYHWDNGYIDNVQTTSDRRFKKDIETSDLGLNFINKIKPVKYKYKDGERNHYGIIAQELKEVIDELGIDFGGYQDHNIKNNEDKLTVGYMELIAPLIKSVQELSKEVKELKKELGR